MKPKAKKILQYGIVLVILAFAVFYIVKNIDDFKQISLINPLWLIPLIFLFLLNYYFIGLQTKVLLEPLGLKLKNFEAYMLSVVTGFYNLITPAHGGMVVRAVYLNKKHNFSYTNFFSSLAGMYVITFFIGSLFGLISMYFIKRIYGFFNLIIFFIFLGLFIPLLVILAFSPEFKETKYDFINKFIKVINGWNLIRKNKKILLTCVLVTSYSLLAGTFFAIFSYYIFGINLSFIQALFLSSINSISILFLLTPGNLGVQEVINVFSASVLGITPVQSIPVALLGRFVQFIGLFILGPVFSYNLLKHNPKNENKRNPKK